MMSNWIGWIMSAVVLALFFLEGVILKDPVRLLITGKRSEGIVVGMESVSRLEETSETDSVYAPIVEFVTSTGERIRVTGRSYSSSSTVTGKGVTVLYRLSNPRDAQLLMWREFLPAVFIAGFLVLFIMMWIAGILITGDSKLDDPFHLLPALIDHLRLNPFRFPALFILSIAIPVCGIGAYLLTKKAFDLRSQGIRVPGYVTGYRKDVSQLSDGSKASGVFPVIRYTDESGVAHTIRRSLAKPLSRLKSGDVVEVIYPVRHPSQGVVNTWDEFWPGPLFFGFMFIAFSVCLVLVLNRTI